MPSRLQRIFLNDFTGGANLRSDAFQLAQNEVADILNMEVDPRGGCSVRRGWERWNEDDATADTWNPRNAFLFTRASAAPIFMVANDDKVLVSSDGDFDELVVSATPVTADADPHGAAFAQWNNDVYVACGRTRQAHRWNGSGSAVALTAAATATWNNDYLTPVQGVFPQCEHTVTHNGYMFVANTRENGVLYPNRLRWSHPNGPQDWAANDYQDFKEISAINAIIPFRDHLLIFGEHTVYAWHGYDSDSWVVSLVSSKAGVSTQTCVTASEDAIFFFSWPDGVFRYDGNTVTEVSLPLRPIFDTAGGFNGGALGMVFVGWLNRRLWFSAPYLDGSSPSDPTTTFVLDPQLESWTIHRGADGFGLGPFVEDVFSSTPRFYGCSRSAPAVMMVDRQLAALDNHTGTDATFDSFFVTRWVDAGVPDGKKSWKRPTFIAKETDAVYDIGYSVYHNFDEAKVKRQKSLTVETGSNTAVYGDGTLYGSGALYGVPPKGSRIERASGLGAASSVQLKVFGTPGKRWGVDGINFKFVSRRYR